MTGNMRSVEEREFGELLSRLQGGEKGIIVDLPWQEEVEGENLVRNQLVLWEVSRERIYFSNPNNLPGLSPGEYGGKEGCGPLRNIEADGRESMNLEDFAQLYKLDGRSIFALPLSY